MSNWYCTRESVKDAIKTTGALRDALIDQHIEASSREIDRQLRRRFIPKTQTRSFRWPQDSDVVSRNRDAYTLRLDEDLLSVSALTGEGDDVVTIPVTEIFLEPANEGPPYSRLEIDRATSDATAIFTAGDTSQRAIRVTGSWGYGNETKAASALAEADDGTETALNVTDSSLIGVGDTLLIGTEQMFVSAKGLLDTTANTNGALTASMSETAVTVTDGSLVKAGEIITINSERMYVAAVSGNVLTVVRAYDGSTLAAHADAQDVYAPRTLTVTRGENGTTAASHADAAAISKYVPPADIQRLCRALVLASYEQDQSGWTGQISGGQAAIAMESGQIRSVPSPLTLLWERARQNYGRRLAMVL